MTLSKELDLVKLRYMQMAMLEMERIIDLRLPPVTLLPLIRQYIVELRSFQNVYADMLERYPDHHDTLTAGIRTVDELVDALAEYHEALQQA